MWCFVSEPNGTIHELTLPKGSHGSDCMEMVSSRIHLVEKDYFGLRYTNPSTGISTWLNLRNKLSDQLTGKAPFRIQLLVKFFVNVQELQQPVTRDLYYLTLIHRISHGEINTKDIDKNTFAQLVAHIAQIDFGDFNAESLPDYSTLIPTDMIWSGETQKLVETEHLKLDMMNSSEAKIGFVKLLSEFVDYGVETFQVHSVDEKPEDLLLSVQHDGLRIYRNGNKGCVSNLNDIIQFIPYDEISTVSYKGRRFTIVHGDTRSEHTHSTFQLKRNQGAIHLFRTFTEFHSFFQCSVVKQSVLEKCSRTCFGRVLSVFKSNRNDGKMFLFDVVCTRRQAYNHAWSILNAPDKKRQSAFYHSDRHFNRKSVYSLCKIEESSEYQPSQSFPDKQRPLSDDFQFFNDHSHTSDKKQQQNKDTEETTLSDGQHISELSVEELRETVNNLLDNKTCQVCMDADVSTAFCPCGHVVCCVDCANMCRECPLCRTQVTYAQRVFFSCN